MYFIDYFMLLIDYIKRISSFEMSNKQNED